MKANLLTILTFLVSFCAYSGIDPVLHHYTTVDGLSHNEVRVMVKSSNGMLWLGTQNGLTAFDGHRFRVFKHNENDSLSICSDKIYSLATGTSGKIWVGTTAGLCSLDPLTGKSAVFKDTFDIKTNLSSALITHLYEDKEQSLWILTDEGSFRYDIANSKLEKIWEGVQVESFYESRANSFWICHDQQVSLYSRKSGKIERSYAVDINKLYEDRFGTLWGVGTRGLFRFMPSQGKFEWLSEVHHPLKQGFGIISEDRQGRLFLGDYGGGVSIYDPKRGEATYLLSYPDQKSGLSSNDVYDIFNDGTGVVWIGTQEGLDYYDWTRQRFVKWQYDPANPKGLSNSFVQYIYRDRAENLWLGTRDNGLEKLQRAGSLKDPQFRHFPPDCEGNSICGEYVTAIFEDSKGRFWVGTMGGGLNLKQSGDSPWRHFHYEKNSEHALPSNSVTSITEDRKGQLLVGSLGGLSVLNMDENGDFIFKNYQSDDTVKGSISGNSVFTIFEDSRGRVWIGINEYGLNLMHEDLDGRVWFEHFRHDPEDSNSLSNDEVFVLFEDSKKRLWVGTSTAGFNRVIEEKDKEGKSSFRFKAYTEREGLPDNEVNGILEDDFGFLWISTNNGLSKFDPDSERFWNYSEYDGVLKGKFRKNAAWKDEDGTMYFGGTGGVNVFNPVHFESNDHVPQPVVTGVLVDGRDIKPFANLPGEQGAVWDIYQHSIEIPEKTFQLKLEVSAMSFASPKRNQLKWMLEGVDQEWQLSEAAESGISYGKLDPGSYTLKLFASNNDGIWNQHPMELTIKVTRQGFSTAWIYGLSSLLIAMFLLIYLIKRWGARTKEEQVQPVSEEDEELVKKLNALMLARQPYMDANLGLADLSGMLEVSTHRLSALLNEVIGKPFYDYINEYRIAEIKRRLLDPEHGNKKIMSIAEECGFNSKSAFNRIFKASTGQTPSEYQKNSGIV
ncbi:ligand-binding sensor domain-containing protein [Echinicola sediminis]